MLDAKIGFIRVLLQIFLRKIAVMENQHVFRKRHVNGFPIMKCVKKVGSTRRHKNKAAAENSSSLI